MSPSATKYTQHPLAITDPQEHLSNALEFDDDDLTANRAGRLSPNQITKLIRYQRQRLRFMIVVIAAGVVFTGLIVVEPSPTLTSDKALEIIVLFWMVVILLEVFYFFQRQRNDQEIVDGTIQMLEGEVYPQRIRTPGRRGPGGGRYIIAIRGKRFWVQPEIFRAFLPDHHYRIYSTPYSKVILSAEYLD